MSYSHCRSSASGGEAAASISLRRKTSGAEYFVVSSDYPHSDGAFPDAMKEFFGMALSAEQRRKILWDNCARLYAIETPAGSLTQPVPRVSAAE